MGGWAGGKGSRLELTRLVNSRLGKCHHISIRRQVIMKIPFFCSVLCAFLALAVADSVGPVETAERYGRVSVDLGIRITKISKPPTFSLTHSLGPVRRRQPHHRWKTCPEERTRFVRGALGRERGPELRWHGAVLTSTTDDRRQTTDVRSRAPTLPLPPWRFTGNSI